MLIGNMIPNLHFLGDKYSGMLDFLGVKMTKEEMAELRKEFFERKKILEEFLKKKNWEVQ